MFVPAFRVLLGLPPKLTAAPGRAPAMAIRSAQPPQYGRAGPPPQQW